MTFSISLQRRSQRTFKTGQVRTAFYRIDIIYIRKNILRKSGIVMQCHFDRHTIFLRRNINGIVNQAFTGIIQELNKLAQTMFRIKRLMFRFVRFRTNIPFICNRQSDSFIQIRQLAQTSRKDVIFIFSHIKNRIIRQESHLRTGALSFSYNFHISDRHSFVILLSPDFSIPANFSHQRARQGIHTRDTDTMQTT